MYLKLTKHFKGSLPVDAGGVVFAGYGQKEVSDEFGQKCVASNFPYVVDCTNEGVPLREGGGCWSGVHQPVLCRRG